MDRAPDALWPALDEPIVLALLEDEPCHGYGLYQKIGELFGSTVRKSHVYRVLDGLEEDGFALSREEQASSRTRFVYELTQDGLARLDDYRQIPTELRGVLASAFAPGIEQDGASALSNAQGGPGAPDTGTRLARGAPAEGWVVELLDQMPREASIEAPHASFTLERDPQAATWSLTVEHHEPGGYEGADACPLTFLYLAAIRLLLHREPPRS